MHRIAAVILNYNSEKDLKISAQQIAGQKGVHCDTILVDNASRPESLAAVKTWLASWKPDAEWGDQETLTKRAGRQPGSADRPGSLYLIENHDNLGYSAGNNAGMRLAELLGADAVLIVNPDMRIEYEYYVCDLAERLFSDSRHGIAASRVVDLEGRDQNPLREPTFMEELCWPRWFLNRFFGSISYVVPAAAGEASVVSKVAGCCMMLKMDFVRQINYLDENVFLYCEEPILASQARNAGRSIVYAPALTAVHAHVTEDKGNAGTRLGQFITSRKYYIERYSGYGPFKKLLLSASYAALSVYGRMKGLAG